MVQKFNHTPPIHDYLWLNFRERLERPDPATPHAGRLAPDPHSGGRGGPLRGLVGLPGPPLLRQALDVPGGRCALLFGNVDKFLNGINVECKNEISYVT